MPDRGYSERTRLSGAKDSSPRPGRAATLGSESANFIGLFGTGDLEWDVIIGARRRRRRDRHPSAHLTKL
jgi:xanthine/CO dehydrogenase XdhC/CoxF family maturation factor